MSEFPCYLPSFSVYDAFPFFSVFRLHLFHILIPDPDYSDAVQMSSVGFS